MERETDRERENERAQSISITALEVTCNTVFFPSMSAQSCIIE